MHGNTGRDGYGWVGESWYDPDSEETSRTDWVMIRADLLQDPNFTVNHALGRMQALKLEYNASEDEWERTHSAPESRKPPKPKRRCAVYRYFDESGTLIYVGKTINPESREKQHMKRAWWPDVKSKVIDWFDSEVEALAVEDLAIKSERPIYNRAGVILP